jgi:hypothetical protein
MLLQPYGLSVGGFYRSTYTFVFIWYCYLAGLYCCDHMVLPVSGAYTVVHMVLLVGGSILLYSYGVASKLVYTAGFI